MASTLYIPKKINVGFQNRKDTYTNKLAYVIYWDDKGVLRKEASWSSWRDKKIENEEFENSPTSGFVLNKKAGGYSSGWNRRQTYIRVYDPRGFEFEITPDNLLFILENTSSIKGKGLEGEFVYSWSGSDLVLLPTECVDYKESLEYTKGIANPIKAKDLKEGYAYTNKKGVELVYLGKHYSYEHNWRSYGSVKSKVKVHFFYNASSDWNPIETISSINMVSCSDDVSVHYNEALNVLNNSKIFSPRIKCGSALFTEEEFKCLLDGEESKRIWWLYSGSEKYLAANNPDVTYKNGLFSIHRENKSMDLKEFMDYFKPSFYKEELENGGVFVNTRYKHYGKFGVDLNREINREFVL